MAEPIALPEAKKHLRVDGIADDELVTSQIIAAREWVEDYTGLILTRREVTESINAFGRRLRLKAWPIAADQPVSIKYRDADGIEQTITTATLHGLARPASIYPAAGTYWPHRYSAEAAISVTFTAGYETAASIPQVLKQAMLVMLTAYYDDREGGDLFMKAEASAKSLCRRYRRWTL